MQDIVANLRHHPARVQLAEAELRQDATGVGRSLILAALGAVFGLYSGWLPTCSRLSMDSRDRIEPWAAAALVGVGVGVVAIVCLQDWRAAARGRVESEAPSEDEPSGLKKDIEMGQGPDQIETSIDATLGRLSENLEELEDKVKSATDWRTQFEKRPAVMAVSIAFAGGVLLAALAHQLHPPSRRRLSRTSGALVGASSRCESSFLVCLGNILSFPHRRGGLSRLLPTRGREALADEFGSARDGGLPSR